MKQNIHPTYQSITATCVCGNSFETGSTQNEIHVDICAACHPFFTNEMRFVDRQGRVDRFRKQMERAQKLSAQTAAANEAAPAASASKSGEPESFRDVLEQQKAALQQSAQ